LEWGNLDDGSFIPMSHTKLMTKPHRGAQTISDRVMKTGYQLQLSTGAVHYYELLHRHMKAQVKRTIEEFLDRLRKVFT